MTEKKHTFTDEYLSSQISKLSGLIYCVKNEEAKVLHQNEACIERCGDLKNEICSKGCMEFFSKLTAANKDRNGFHFFQKKNINGDNFDIAILKKAEFIISYLHVSHDSSETSKKLLNNPSLTKREKEILTLKLEKGLTMKEISGKLFISRATLKTHLNNINKKLVKPH